jgi:rifampicin phosphotransferase
MKKSFLFLIIAFLLFSVTTAFAQAVRKPSAMRASRQELAQKATTSKNSLLKIASQAEFDEFARVYHQNTPYALPHLMFLIDRKDKNKIYYINSKKFRFHRDFANAAYLSLERGEAFTQSNYLRDDRRFILGTLAWQTPIKKWTFEFWEGDTIPSAQIKLAHDVINKSFFEAVAFKPNSIRQEDASASLEIERISASEINQGQEYLALNTARGVGRVHVIEKLDETVEIGYNEILVLKEVPLNLPPVAGIIVAKPSTPLSHVNLLAKGWNIPNAYIKDADKLFKDYNGRWFEFETKLDNYSFKPATTEVLRKWDVEEKQVRGIDDSLKTPPTNLDVTKLATLREMRKKDSVAYGAKAANLGEIINSRLPGVVVPEGFSVPFVYYKKFMEANGFEDKVVQFLDDYDFVHNPKIRREKLKAFREEIKNAPFDESLKVEIIKKWQTYLGSRGVFVRSSSNVEDLPNFSGAGLYDTVPNVKDAEKLIEAVKTVWASTWNYEAYEARERNFVDHTGAYMSAFIQVGVDMDNGGVLITRDPFDKENKGAVYIAATRGHNITVTGDGRKIPEQILFTPKSNSVQVLTRSTQDTVVSFDENGGLKETPVSTERRVLNDNVARDLVRAAQGIKRIFGGRQEQDIEWGYLKGRIIILQSRPYIDKN